MTVRVRFAPSPTGSLHLGTARTAVVNWLFARSQGGELVLRLDDTDRERSTEQSADELLTDLEWLGIDWDEGPLLQSERQGSYEAALAELDGAELTYIDDGATYMRVPGGEPLAFDDLLHGRIEFPAGSKDDFVIRRSDGSFTYNFATAIDDSEMDITHVIRGEDHISNTPLQVLVIAGIGKTPPQYLHLPLLLAEEGSKLSKRLGAVSVAEYREQGYLPEALLNYLALTVFTPTTEILSADQLLDEFDLTRLHHSAARFDVAKLRWVARTQMVLVDDHELAGYLRPLVPDLPVIPVTATKRIAADSGVTTVVELGQLLCAVVSPRDPDADAIAIIRSEAGQAAIAAVIFTVGELRQDRYRFDESSADRALEIAKATLKKDGVPLREGLPAVRAALMGRAHGPQLSHLLAALKPEEIVARLSKYQ